MPKGRGFTPHLDKILNLKAFSKKLLILVRAAKIFDFSYRDLVFFCCDAFGFIIRDVDFSLMFRKQCQDAFYKSSRLVFCSEFLDGSNFSLETDVKNLVKKQEYKEKQIQNLKKKMLLSSKNIPYIDFFLFFCESLSSIVDDKNFFSKILDLNQIQKVFHWQLRGNRQCRILQEQNLKNQFFVQRPLRSQIYLVFHWFFHRLSQFFLGQNQFDTPHG